MRLDGGSRPFLFVIVAFTALFATILFSTITSVGIAQEATPDASPTACPEATPGAMPTASGTPCPEGTPQGGRKTITITSFDIYFEPREVTIPANSDVTIKLPNEGVTLHNFSITDHKNENLPFAPIDIDINPGDTKEATINAPAGDYYFYCNVPGHEAAGMFGTLTVK